MNSNHYLMDSDNDLLIIELDDRLEFSAIHPAVNAGTACVPNTGNCVAQCNTNCANCHGCGG